jgi:hypothetical protein
MSTSLLYGALVFHECISKSDIMKPEVFMLFKQIAIVFHYKILVRGVFVFHSLEVLFVSAVHKQVVGPVTPELHAIMN